MSHDTTNFVEHLELVAERIIRFAEIVGRKNVHGSRRRLRVSRR